jgi:DNA repair photolyase
VIYKEIEVKGILNSVKGPDEWFGLSYNLNLYRGCEHQCIYCDSRSACYRIENFNHEVLIKINALDHLEDVLAHKRNVGIVGFGSMNDPYTFAEEYYRLTGQALKILAKYHFPVHIITKSDMVLKDLETLKLINRVKARVSFTVTTTDDALAKIIEPAAPSPSRRLAALKRLSEAGIETGVVMMPVLPYIEDTTENVISVVDEAAKHGASYIIPSFGMTIREGQRGFFYQKLDEHFPGLREKYQKTFGVSYHCPAQNHDALAQVFYAACEKYGIRNSMSSYPSKSAVTQLNLFNSFSE